MPEEKPQSALDYAPPVSSSNASAVQVGIVFIKIIGLYQLVQVIQWLPYVLGTLTGKADWSFNSPWLTLLGPFITGSLGFLLIRRAESIGTRLFRDVPDMPIEVGPAGWMTILISAIGLYLIVSRQPLPVEARAI